jgi:hypothetical protein
MVVTSTTLTSIKTNALAEFDDLIQMAFGTGTTTPTISDTTLGTEVDRNAFDESPIKSVGSGTYDFSGFLALTEGNGNDISEIGLFDASSSGNMKLRELLSDVISKTSTIDLGVGVRITIEVENI